eukprot:3516671-Amphidinium_carterae.1
MTSKNAVAYWNAAELDEHVHWPIYCASKWICRRCGLYYQLSKGSLFERRQCRREPRTADARARVQHVEAHLTAAHWPGRPIPDPE